MVVCQAFSSSPSAFELCTASAPQGFGYTYLGCRDAGFLQQASDSVKKHLSRLCHAVFNGGHHVVLTKRHCQQSCMHNMTISVCH